MKATVFLAVAVPIFDAARADPDRAFPIGRPHNPDWPIMNLDPDEKKLLESFERGEWKPVDAGEISRMRELALNQLSANMQAEGDSLGGGEGISHERLSGRDSIESRRPANAKKR